LLWEGCPLLTAPGFHLLVFLLFLQALDYLRVNLLYWIIMIFEVYD